jgi:hypothetical protein
MAIPPQTSWIWHDEATGGVMGVAADLDDRTLTWFDQPGCACGGPEDVQSIADFMTRGAKYLDPPPDIITEMRAALAAYA